MDEIILKKKTLSKKGVILSLAEHRSIDEIQATVNLLFAEEEGFATTNVSFHLWVILYNKIIQDFCKLKF